MIEECRERLHYFDASYVRETKGVVVIEEANPGNCSPPTNAA